MFDSFVRFLQISITPVALISGVGLLLLTLTNRLGRTIDRTRYLVAELERGASEFRNEKIDEIVILSRRNQLLRASIALMALSLLCSSLIIPLLALAMWLKWSSLMPGYFLFSISILSIIASIIYFFRDILLSLKAVNLEARFFTASSKK